MYSNTQKQLYVYVYMYLQNIPIQPIWQQSPDEGKDGEVLHWVGIDSKGGRETECRWKSTEKRGEEKKSR